MPLQLLTGAARKLFHVFGKRLRAQLQPLDHREIGKELVGYILHSHARADGNGRCLNQFARFRFGQAHRRHLRVGEHHGGHGGQVEGGLAAGHVDRRARTGGGRDIDELRLISAIAGGIDVRRTAAHLVVNHDIALCAECLRHRYTDGRILAEEQSMSRQDRDLAAQPRVGLCQFQCDNRRADYGELWRNAVAHQCFGRSPVGGVSEFGK